MIKAIVTDIEGTTTSVSFVFDVLFPYFIDHIDELNTLREEHTDVAACFEGIKKVVAEEEGIDLDNQGVLDQLRKWVKEDRKEQHLKTLQGIVWKGAYESGAIKGHLYDDVPDMLKKWHQEGISLAVYSSGSVPAQQLLFGHSEYGDLTALFSHYFDTRVGGKREVTSYTSIAATLGLSPQEILFLSDIEAELDAASRAGLQVIQLVRPGTIASERYNTAAQFNQINLATFA